MIHRKNFNFYFLVLLLFACNRNPLDIKPSAKKLPISFINLDSLIKKTPSNDLINKITASSLRKNEVLSYELNHCLGVGNLQDSGALERIQLFLQDPFIARLEKRIDERFSNLDYQRALILNGFLFLNHHFPKGKIPEHIVFMNSFFASNVFCTEHEIAVGLERYLGPETDVIKELPSQDFFQWVKDKMKIEYLERDVLTAWILTHYVPEDKQNIIASIVNWGKIIYLTEAAFPEMKPHLLLRYSEKDYEWSLKNEYAFWKYLVQQKMLFSKNERDMANFLNDAPFTIGLPEKGPDRLGQFLGWRIVHAYMEQYPDTTLEELVKLNYTKILQTYEVE